MPTEHEGLDGEHQRLDPQDHGMHKPNRIHRMENDAFDSADIAGLNQIVVAGIGVGNAAAARR